MAQSIPLPTLAAMIDGAGIWAPSYPDILASLTASYAAIFGSDAYLEPDSQDGQWLAVIALAIFDSNMAMIATYNAFSPATAVGAGLSSVVKINGLSRMVPSYSTVPVDIGGTVGCAIANGIVGDTQDRRWFLPATVTIPAEGVITVTATAENPGQLFAGIGSIKDILTPQPGWQTVTNRFTAAPGQPVESDYTLRRRQSVSTALPAQAILAAILANVEAVAGVSRAEVFENDSGSTDADGLPPHSIAVVVEGGDTVAIATAIANTKPPGSYSYGSVSHTVTDPKGVENLVRWWPLQLVTITIEVDLAPLDGWLSHYADDIVAQLVEFVSTLPIGYDSYLSKLFSAAELPEPMGLAYDVTAIRQRGEGVWFAFDDPAAGFDEGFWQTPLAAADVAIAFNQAAVTQAANIQINYPPAALAS